MKHLLLKTWVVMLCLLVGVGTTWAESFNTTYSYGLSGWSLTNYTDQSSYYQVPSGNAPSVATISGIFTGKTITSNVVVTINCATYGGGTNPSASTFSLYQETACTNAITATQGGTLPTSSTYTDVTYTVTQANAASLSDDLAIKITKPGKTIRLKSIKVAFTYTTGTPVAKPTNLSAGTPTSSSTTLSWDVVEHATAYKVEYKVSTAGSWTAVTPNPTTNSCTISGLTASTTYAWQVTALSTEEGYSDGSAQAGTNFTTAAPASHKVYFYVNGTLLNEGGTSYTEGSTITFPADPSETSGKVFRGWVTTPIDGTTNTAPSFVNKANETLGTTDLNYYAVFATATAEEDTWNQVKTLANIVEGQYVIKNGNFVLSNAVATSSAPAALDAPTVTTGVITGTVEDNMIFNLTSTGTANQFYVKNPDGKYLYATNNNNGLRINTTQDNWTFAVNTAGYFSMKDANNSRYCGKYTDGADWRSYTTATAANYVNSGKLELYKLTSNTTYSDYCTSFANVTLIGIEVTGTPDEFWKGDAFNHEGITVTATWSDESKTDVTALAEFSTPDMSTSGQQTVTVTYKDETTTYTIEVKTIANTAETAYTSTQAKALIDAGKDLATEVYVKGEISSILSGSVNDEGKLNFYIDSDNFEFYGCLNIGEAKFTSVDQIAVGATIVGKGTLTKYRNTYEFGTGCQLVSYIAPEPKEVATISAPDAKTTMAVGDADDEYTVSYNGDGELEITSSNENVAEAIIVDNEVLISAVGKGTTTITISAPATENYYAATYSYTLTVVKLADLPFWFNGGKNDIADKDGMSQDGLGSDYSSSPKLKFDGTNDEVVINYTGEAGVLQYTIKGNSFANSTFDVKESANGTDYTLVKTYTKLDDELVESCPLSADTRFVKFVYREKVNGNVALGAIKIFAGHVRNVKTNDYGTICLPYAVTAPVGATFYTVSNINNETGSITLSSPVSSLVAGTPYIFKATKDDVVCEYTGEAVAEPIADTYLTGVFDATPAPANSYVLQNQSGVVGFYQVGSIVPTVGAYRAYLNVPGSDARVLTFGDETAIKAIDALTSGKAEIFDLQGRRLNNLQKGINIVNGVKILVK